MITSTHNPVVKSLKSILRRQGKEDEKYFLAESIKIVKEALDSGADIRGIFFTQHFLSHQKESHLLKLCKEKNIPCEEISVPVFQGISMLEHSDGILAQAVKKKYDFSDVEKKKDSVIVVLEHIQDPGNVGTMLRLCDAFGASAVFLGKGCASLYNPKVIRASMGAFFHLPSVTGDAPTFLKWLRENKYKIILSDARGGKAIYETQFSGRCAFAFGNESKGLSSWFYNHADIIACIPQHGKLNSINVALACALFLYERQRQTSRQ